MLRGQPMTKRSEALYRTVLRARKRGTWNDVVIAREFGVSRQRVNQCVVAIRKAGVVLPDLRKKYARQRNVVEFVRATAKRMGLTVKEV